MERPADCSSYPETINPFEDPAVIELSTDHQQPDLGQLYNPFEGNRGAPPPYHPASGMTTTPLPPAPPPERPPAPLASRTARKQSPGEQKTYGTQEPSPILTADLLRQQEELERKAAELDRKERELQNAAIASGGPVNNWPPLPSFCPVKPCFYQDIKTDIPVDVQKTVTVMYYLWMLSSGVLFFNLLGSLAWFMVHVEAGTHFGLSILWLVLFTPCSFVCWYRPMYKAFRNDSSFNFFTFFFVFLVQDILFVLQSVGIPGWGFCTISPKQWQKMDITSAHVQVLWLEPGASPAPVPNVHYLYRRTGASFQKAQEELAAGVMSNQVVRNAASNAAGAAAQNAFQRN
uniref:secretory carrier-associated membrane protein 3-like n=1 Tax=Pristiophorus japonicus TaxID=55135 RepID=UPI00398F6734